MLEINECTSFLWCQEAKVRVLDLSTWPDGEEAYFTKNITKEKFLELLAKCKVKPNSQPRKSDMYLEYRMYGLVPYNISPIQQGIQFGHAVVRYGQTVKGIEPAESIYNKYANKDETFIILNGGTTNKIIGKLGSLNIHLATLVNAGILVQDFYEPDLGDQLTAICFLVDERVFNRILYPDFQAETLPWSKKKPSEKAITELIDRNTKNFLSWEEKIGGPKNSFLRDYLKPLKLA
jgi:hypothetical protein